MRIKTLTDMRGWEDTSSSHWTVPHREELLGFTSQLQGKKKIIQTAQSIYRTEHKQQYCMIDVFMS